MVFRNKRQAEKPQDLSSTEQAVVWDLLENYYANRGRVYRQNFIRGVFFGMGSFLGGTIVIALIVWLLSMFADVPGAVGDFVDAVVKTLNVKQH